MMNEPRGMSDRLRHAMGAKGWGATRLHEVMAEVGGPRTSYGTVRRYVLGITEPPVSFLEIAAQVLDVDLSWLVLGRGAPQPSEPVPSGAEADVKTMASFEEDGLRPALRRRRRRAISRLLCRLDGFHRPGARWTGGAGRRDIIQMAVSALAQAEDELQHASSVDPPPTRELIWMRLSQEPSDRAERWYAEFADAVLYPLYLVELEVEMPTLGRPTEEQKDQA